MASVSSQREIHALRTDLERAGGVVASRCAEEA